MSRSKRLHYSFFKISTSKDISRSKPQPFLILFPPWKSKKWFRLHHSLKLFIFWKNRRKPHHLRYLLKISASQNNNNSNNPNCSTSLFSKSPVFKIPHIQNLMYRFLNQINNRICAALRPKTTIPPPPPQTVPKQKPLTTGKMEKTFAAHSAWHWTH